MCKYLGLLVWFMALDVAGAADSSRVAIGAILEATSSNREAFDGFDCSFEVCEAHSSSLEDALHGRFLPSHPVRRRFGRWLVSGQLVRYELLCDAKKRQATLEEIRAAAKERKVNKDGSLFLNIACADEFCLMNGERYSGNLGSLIGGFNILVGQRDITAMHITPFSMGVMAANEYSSPTRYLRDYLNGKFQGRFAGVERIIACDAMVVEIADRMRFGFDPERGHLPVFISDKRPETGKLAYQAYLIEAREVPGKGWFPTRTVTIRRPENLAPLEVLDIRVTNLVVDPRPLAENIALEIPSGTQVSVANTSKPAITYFRQNEIIRADQLEALHKRCLEETDKFHARRAQAQAVAGSPPESAWTDRLVRVLVANIVILALAGGVWWLRRRRLRKPAL